jgi:acyl transferase domain-containing protein/NADPH:quinone reductase-like Zn-dependent oxidoreductase/NAD(P)-dependent dehydrogenase (short-subunit alcohol dehydrogenase family)
LPEVAHPLCTALQVALVDLFASWGIFPTHVTGHSSGEIAAAYCAGKLSREAAWKVAYLRGYVSSKQLSAKGAMMAVGLPVQQLEPYLESVRKDFAGELIIACRNSPKNNTVSGDEALIDYLKDLLEDDAVFARKLNVKNAYHSAHMQAIAGDYLRFMGTLSYGRRLAAPHPVHMFSTVTGKEVKEYQLPGQYWVDNMVSPVLFTSGLTEMTSQSTSCLGLNDSDHLRLLVEIGPHSTLRSAIKETLTSKSPKLEYKYFPVLKRTDHNLNTILTTLGFLGASGCELDFHAVNQAFQSQARRRSQLLVDLPPYSFKHTEKILYESRLSKNLRTRKFPRHDLFGAPITDWNPIAPRWRHFVRLDENPWLRDHVVTGNYVYPGVGYLVMAIEASRQLAGDGKTTAKITGFHLRQVSMKRALIVPDTKEGIEVSLSMTNVEDSPSTSRIWRRFHITSYNASSDEWTEHCTGQIMVEHESPPDPVDAGREAAEEMKAWKADLAHANKICSSPVNFKSIYNSLRKSGLAFGPLFQNLSEVRGSGLGPKSALGSVVGSVTVPDIAQCMPKQFMHSHLIHPATMDSMIHLMIAAVMDYTGRSTLDQIRLPTFIRDVWVSADLNSAPSHKFTGHACVSTSKSHKIEGQIRILDEESNTQYIRMDDIELTPLENDLCQKAERKLCSAIEWKPDVHFLYSNASCGLTALATTDTKAQYWVKQLQLATMLYVTDALAELKDADFMKLDLHMQRFVDWMKHYHQLLKSNEIIHLPYKEFQQVAQNPALKESIGKEIESHSAEGAITARMGRNIVLAVRQEVDPLHLMFGQDDLMEQVYKEGLHLYNLPQHLQNHLSLLRHHHSDLNILEIGGGTGSFTAEVLAVLSPDPEKSKGSVASYTFTDISSGFFERAKQRFQPWADIMKFQSLNIERDPVDQGLQPGTYDLIVAGNVIHATANLQTTLQNLRSLLRPGGQLIMQEGIRQDFLWYPLVFGQLPGWWLGDEPIRKWCPYIPATEWDTLLQESGFSGVDIEYPSSDDPDLTWQSILVSSAVTGFQEKPLGDAFIMTSGLYPKSIDESMVCLIQEMGYTNVLILEPSKIQNNVKTDSLCISLLDLNYNCLDNMSESEYQVLKGVLTKCHNILWVTTDHQSRPHSSMSLGLLRSLRWERDADGSNIVVLTVADDNNCLMGNLDRDICKIVKRQFVDELENDRHAEYLLRDGITHIGRLKEWDAADQFLASQSASQPSGSGPQLQRIGHIDQPIQVQEPDSRTGDFVWVTDRQHETPLGDTQVEIYMQAVGLSSPGLSNSLSNEAAGFVTKIGCRVTSLSPGDRVVCVSGDKDGCFRTHIRVCQKLVAKIPSNISFETAASLPVALLTTDYALSLSEISCYTGSWSTILIHDGMAPVSRTAIQVALAIEAEVYVCVATVEDRMFIVSEYGIPEHRIFSSLMFSKGVMRCTNGKGVMISFNTPSGEALQETLKCISPFGNIFEFAGSNEDGKTTIDLASIPRCASIHRVNIPLMAQLEGDLTPLLSDRLRESLILYSEGRIKEIQSVTVMDFSQIKEGIQAQSSGKAGSIVFTLNPSTMIPVVPQPTTPYQFDSNASYVLAGGYGGLGRSLARWMASRGARNLIFLSRSSASTLEKVEMITDLTNMDCKVHSFACDVSDTQSLTALSEGTFSNLPPIKGCIQASMVLRVSQCVSDTIQKLTISQDGAFEGLSYEDWQAAIKPKVQGSWNLHETLPNDMDFFVMLSSVAGIFGNRGQSNYAAGNTFQDALAAHRVSQGLKASSINLGSVSNVGWVAENRDTIRTNTAPLFELISEDEVHAAVEFLIDPRNGNTPTKNSPGRSQLVLGLPTAEMCRQNGVPAPTYLNYSMFTHFRNTATAKTSETSEQKTISTAALLRATSGTESVVTVISDGIVDRLASLLAIPASELDAQRFGFGGIDSLVAMEFRSWITKELQAEVSLLDIMGAESIRALSEKIAGMTGLVEGSS